MKLEIDLVPSTAWYSNLKTKIPVKEWDKIRKRCYADVNYKCQICGSDGKNQIFVTRGSIKGTLNCHEIWEYDDNKHIQKLEGFLALCNDCHMIKHIGFASIQDSKGLLDMDKLIGHFMKVNGVSRKTFDKHHEESLKVMGERSQHEWKTNFAQWSNLINSSSTSSPSHTS